jgi:small subunit ribosomal protein S8
MTDPIADMLSRIRNGIASRKAKIEIPGSKLKARIAEILQEEGFVSGVQVTKGEGHGQGTITVTLRYDRSNESAIAGIKRVSRPGQRTYSSTDALPKFRGGLGTSIITTSKGVMTDREARKQRLGGEIICQVW